MMKKLLLGLLLCSVGVGAAAGQVQRSKENICENHPDKEQCLRELGLMIKAAVAAGDAKGACDASIASGDQMSEDNKVFCEKVKNRVKEFTSE